MFSPLSSFLARFGMRYQWRNPSFYAVLCGDALLFSCALVAAYLCRFEFKLAYFDRRQIIAILPYTVPMKLLVFWGFGLYRGMWRYTSLKDFWRLAQASFVSMVLAVVIVAYLYHFAGHSRAVFLLDGLFTFLLTGAFRILIRSYYEGAKAQTLAQAFFLSGARSGREGFKKVLLIGAGNAGEKILREIFDNPHLQYEIVGILDDDLSKQGYELHGIPVLGPVETAGGSSGLGRREEASIQLSSGGNVMWDGIFDALAISAGHCRWRVRGQLKYLRFEHR